MEPDKDRFPYSLVFTPIPLLSWLCPIIGHLGICDSLGRVHDFSASRTVSLDRMAFGRPAIFSPLIPCEKWDNGVAAADNAFKCQNHNLISNNCHHHVARCLNEMQYLGRNDYTALSAYFLLWKSFRLAPRRHSFMGLIVPFLCLYAFLGLLFFWST
jgi:transmembrane protein 222